MADDAIMESAIEDTLAAGGDALLVVAPLPHLRRVFHDDGDVARLLDEISPPVSEPDEQLVLEDPRLLAMVIVRALGASSWAVLGAAVITPPAGFGGGDVDDTYSNGGFGAVPASAAAVADLKKATFRAGAGGDGGDCATTKGRCGGGGVTGCAVCLEEFEDGEEVTEMPCERGHGFHSNCITEWLGCSNMCPICRHPLPTSCVDDK